MKIIDSRIHGLIDYLVVVFLLAAPALFGLPATTALFTYVLGGIHLALTMLTKFELGLIKVIPFPLHGWIELAVALALVGVAFYLGGLGRRPGPQLLPRLRRGRVPDLGTD